MRLSILRVAHGWPSFGLQIFGGVNFSGISFRTVLKNFHVLLLFKVWDLSVLHYLPKADPVCLLTEFYRLGFWFLQSSLTFSSWWTISWSLGPSGRSVLVLWIREGWFVKNRSRIWLSLVGSLAFCFWLKKCKMFLKHASYTDLKLYFSFICLLFQYIWGKLKLPSPKRTKTGDFRKKM